MVFDVRIDLDAPFAKRDEHRVEVPDAVVHHQLSLTRPEVRRLGWKDRPHRLVTLLCDEALGDKVRFWVDAEMFAIPRTERFRIFRAKEHAADAEHAFAHATRSGARTSSANTS